jgi:hypothetical protein
VTHGNSEETKQCKYHSEEWVTELTIQKYFSRLDLSGNYTYQQVFKTEQFYILSMQRLYMCSLRSLQKPSMFSLCNTEQTAFIREIRFVLCWVRIKSLYMQSRLILVFNGLELALRIKFVRMSQYNLLLNIIECNA